MPTLSKRSSSTEACDDSCSLLAVASTPHCDAPEFAWMYSSIVQLVVARVPPTSKFVIDVGRLQFPEKLVYDAKAIASFTKSPIVMTA